jgi:hypothetical protein
LFEEKDRFRWGVVKQPIMFKDLKFMDEVKIPLEDEHVDVVFSDLQWGEIEWDSKYVYVRGEQVGPMKCFKFITNR